MDTCAQVVQQSQPDVALPVTSHTFTTSRTVSIGAVCRIGRCSFLFHLCLLCLVLFLVRQLLFRVSHSAIPSTFAFLTSASLSELQAFDADPSLLHSHLATLPTWQHMQHIYADMLDTLTEQAALSLQQQPEYARMKREVEDTRRLLNEETKEVEGLVRRQQDVTNRYSVERTLQQMQRLAEEAEKKSEAMRDRYMEGGDEDAGGAAVAVGAAGGAAGDDGAVMADDEKDVSSARRGDRHSRFVEAYVKQRMAVHERLAKRERLMEWAAQRQQQQQYAQ